MNKTITEKLRARTTLVVNAIRPQLRYVAAYSVEGERTGRLWLYGDGHYEFLSHHRRFQRGQWHVDDGSLLVFDEYVRTLDLGQTFYSPWTKLTLIRQRAPIVRQNASPYYHDPARIAYHVPKLHDREQAFFPTLPVDAIAAEIGVETGSYSAQLLHDTRPRQLHLIDCWEDTPDPWPLYEVQARNYRDVCDRFADEIQRGQIVIHKGDDLELLPQFPDSYFDWVYLDTSHFYEHTLRELRTIAPKMKRGGLICGHDYSDTTHSRQRGWGVVRAVNEFVRDYGWELRFLTRKAAATYVIARTDRATI